ncbi:MAG: BatD family protein [Candidatus Krumholzibacteriia bacterium]
MDRTHATLDDQITLDVTVRGRFKSAEQPRRPPLEDFEVYYRGSSQSISYVNGELSASHTFTYVLVPKREGKLTIGSFTLEHRRKEYSSEPIRITVGGRAPDTAGGPQEERTLFVVARADKERAYVNEQIIYTFYLYATVRVSNLNYTQPKFEGFWVEKLQEGDKQYYKMLNGRRYHVIEVSTAVFPATSGTLRIDPGKLRLMQVSERSYSFFERGVERVLRSRPVEIEVLPLPNAGRPAHFDGAVGEDLTISAKLERTEVEEGEPVTLTVRVRGSGNVRTFSKPRLPALPNFKVYDADSKTKVRRLDRVSGTRTYEVVLVPREAGEYRIPPIRLAYFDTHDGRYRTVETKPFPLTAVRTARSQQMLSQSMPRQQDIEVLGEDIAHIRTDVAVSDQRTPLYLRGLFVVLLPLPFLTVVGALMVQRRRDRLASDVALARSSRARKVARKRLSEAAKFLAAGRGEEFYAEVSRALLQYSGDKLNVSAASLTHDGLRRHLFEAGANEDTRERLVQVLEHCDAARFSPGSFSETKMRDVLQEATALVMEMEQRWNRKGSRLTMMCLALVCGLCTFGDTAGAPVPIAQATETDRPGALHVGQEPAVEFMPPQELLKRGHAAYEAGRFDQAIEAYLRAENLGVRNGPLYYNLGNAYYKNGNLGLAIAKYRRAQMLIPRDRLLRANLEYVVSQREDKALQPPVPWPVTAARAVFSWLSLNEWVVVTALVYVLTCVIGLFMILHRNRRFAGRIALYTSVSLLVLSSATLAYKVHEERGVGRGVVAAEKVSVMSGPGQDYTIEFWLHEGTEVEIEVHRPDWLRVSIGGSLRGWIPKESIARI